MESKGTQKRELQGTWKIHVTLRPEYTPSKGAFTIYVYNARWVGGQKSGKFVNVYSIKIVNEVIGWPTMNFKDVLLCVGNQKIKMNSNKQEQYPGKNVLRCPLWWYDACVTYLSSSIGRRKTSTVWYMNWPSGGALYS